MTSFLITLSSKHGQSRVRTDGAHVHEELRRIGLEWKTADQFHDHEVIITIFPGEDQEEYETKQTKIREAMEALDSIL